MELQTVTLLNSLFSSSSFFCRFFMIFHIGDKLSMKKTFIPLPSDALLPLLPAHCTGQGVQYSAEYK